MTFEEVLADIKQQLDWRGPSGKPMAHIVLNRDDAELLINRVLEMILKGSHPGRP